MLRITLFFLFTLSYSLIFGKDLSIVVKEGWKTTPAMNVSATLKSNVGRVLEEVKTDSLGEVRFVDLTYGYHTVEIASIGDDFEGCSFTFKLTENREMLVLLQPTRSYRLQQLAWEDEKYGPENSPRKAEKTETPESENSTTSTDVDADAEFPGGIKAMQQFISDNLIYPDISRELGEQGRVYIQFIVEPDGVITHISVLRGGISEELNNEAERLIRMMPKWKPGIVNGTHVRARCRLPITFILH